MNREENKAETADWDFYFSNVNDVLSSLMVNLSAIRRAADPAKAWLLWVWVYMLEPRHDGLSSVSYRIHHIWAMSVGRSSRLKLARSAENRHNQAWTTTAPERAHPRSRAQRVQRMG